MFIPILIASAFCFLMYMIREAFRNEVETTFLVYPDLPKVLDGKGIFFISDIHRRRVSPAIIGKVKGKADFVIIGGDLTEKGVPEHRIRKNIEDLKQIGPVYFVWGNNDIEAGKGRITRLLEDGGVEILENRSVYLPDSGRGGALVGIGDTGYGLDDVELAFSGLDPSVFTIVVCHNPDIFGNLPANRRLDLFLSGHTHGGQIRLFGLGIYPPGGWKKEGKTHILHSNGYGTTLLPLRFGARAKTHFIVFKRGSCRELPEHPAPGPNLSHTMK